MKKQMTYGTSKQWTILPLILSILLISMACLTLTNGTPAGTQAPEEVEAVEVDVDFGPGSFNFPDTKAGLADLSSYKATLTLSFDGTRDGQAQKWSKNYVMLSSKEPANLQLTIEKTGDLTDLEPVFMAEANGADYARRGENACTANAIEEGNSLRDRLELAGFLTFVIGAEEAGSETVNEVASDNYTFDEHASGQSGIAKSTGEMWVASNGGYIVKYLLTTEGNADYFGEGIEGTLSLDYELTDINQPLTIELPADCPAGMLDVPLLPDAADVVNMPGLLTYTTITSMADAAAFYQEQIPGLGWIGQGEPTITETMAYLSFTQGNQEISVIISVGAAVTNVQVMLGKVEE